MISSLGRALPGALGCIPGPTDVKRSEMNYFSEPV